MKSFELSVLERLLLLSMLPKEGNIATIRIVQDMRYSLSFSEEEHKVAEFSAKADGTLHWNPEYKEVKNVQLGEKAVSTISDALKELDAHQKLTEQHLSLWEKFVDTE